MKKQTPEEVKLRQFYRFFLRADVLRHGRTVGGKVTSDVTAIVSARQTPAPGVPAAEHANAVQYYCAAYLRHLQGERRPSPSESWSGPVTRACAADVRATVHERLRVELPAFEARISILAAAGRPAVMDLATRR